MKAEQRKELETNTLADKVGQVMQRVKASPRRTFFTYFFIGLAVLVAAWFAWNWWKRHIEETSFEWVQFYDGSAQLIVELNKKETPAGKAARFQLAWVQYWDHGVKQLGRNQQGALSSIKDSVKRYALLATECKDDDTVFKLQAMLGQAVGTETLAVEELSNLTKAKGLYQQIVDEFDTEKDKGKYAEVKFAQQRLELLKDTSKATNLTETYQDLNKILGIKMMLPVDHPNINIKK